MVRVPPDVDDTNRYPSQTGTTDCPVFGLTHPNGNKGRRREKYRLDTDLGNLAERRRGVTRLDPGRL